MRGDHAVGGAVELPRVELRVLRRGVVEHLQFAHAGVGGVAFARVADREAVVAAGRQLELEARDEVRVLLLRVDGAALFRLAANRAVYDLVVVERARPAGEVLAVEDGREGRLVALAQDRVGFLGRDLADEDVAPADLAAVRLQLDRPRAQSGSFGPSSSPCVA